jgi:hypothetical protein
MRGAWGMLVTMGAFVVMGVMVTSMASDYLDTHTTLLGDVGGQVNMATATLERMRSLIGHLEIR